MQTANYKSFSSININLYSGNYFAKVYKIKLQVIFSINFFKDEVGIKIAQLLENTRKR